ncbi:MAG: phosphopantothenoylcysteine decarboxylase [Opitutales bacterium]|nr:phosphopantothenoylcysteine decarboxylase [Opitutales bacterium]
MGGILEGKTVALGVTGSIAAYKAADICSQLVKLGADVHVILTESGARFISPLTLRTMSRNQVIGGLWDDAGWKPGHIDIADSADLLLVAPATAHKIAEFAQGLAPDMLTCTYLATLAPTLIAPAMNGKMLDHPATQANIATLRERGVRFVDSADGMLACGYEGKGRLAPVELIVEQAVKILTA